MKFKKGDLVEWCKPNRSIELGSLGVVLSVEPCWGPLQKAYEDDVEVYWQEKKIKKWTPDSYIEKVNK